MKIKDVVLSEAPASQQFPLQVDSQVGSGASGFPLTPQARAAISNNQGRGTQPVKSAPKKKVAPKKKPAAQPAADPSLDPYDPYKDPNVQMTPPSAGWRLPEDILPSNSPHFTSFNYCRMPDIFSGSRTRIKSLHAFIHFTIMM